MSRWRDRLIRKYGGSEIPEIPETAFESPSRDHFGNNGNFGTGIWPETDPAEWQGEVEHLAPDPATDHGDETEHDAWLAGTPIAEIGR